MFVCIFISYGGIWVDEPDFTFTKGNLNYAYFIGIIVKLPSVGMLIWLGESNIHQRLHQSYWGEPQNS